MIENWTGSEVSINRVWSSLIWCCIHLSRSIQSACGSGLPLWLDAFTFIYVYTKLCKKNKTSYSYVFFIFILCKLLSVTVLYPLELQIWAGMKEMTLLAFLVGEDKLLSLKRSPWLWSFWRSETWGSFQWEVSCVALMNECWSFLWPLLLL